MNGSRLLVSVLTRLNVRLAELARTLRSNPEVQSVSTALTPRQYGPDDRVECYVDVALRNGNGVGMWFEFRWEDGSWIIESSIRHNTDLGEDEILGLPTRYAVEDAELAEELDGASRALVRAAQTLDFALL